MLSVYLVTLIVGGLLVMMSAFLGGDTDTDFDADADFDADTELDAEADLDGEAGDGGFGDVVTAWFPYGSLRFWTFFAAFFGLTGTLLEALASTGTGAANLAAASGVGYMTGLGVTRVIRRLQSERVDSTVRENDLLGMCGRVVVPIGPSGPGKVRIDIKGRTIDVIAQSPDERLSIGDAVVIIATNPDGTVDITASERLLAGTERAGQPEKEGGASIQEVTTPPDSRGALRPSGNGHSRTKAA